MSIKIPHISKSFSLCLRRDFSFSNLLNIIGDAYYDDYIYPQKYGINTILYNNKRYAKSCHSLKELYKKIKIIAKS